MRARPVFIRIKKIARHFAAALGIAAGSCTLGEDGSFARCDDLREQGTRPEVELTDEQRQGILDGAIDANIANSGALGSPGQPVQVILFVLDDESLAKLATIASPEQVCVEGQDPADFVELGPQPLSGPGWRWLGASETRWRSDIELITNDPELAELWRVAFPSEPAPVVDFESETVLVLQTNHGIRPIRCGLRLDGMDYDSKTNTLNLDLFRPGGAGACLTIAIPGLYIVAFDLEFAVPPFELTITGGPREEPVSIGTIG